jgi:hypothetical protein
VLGGRNVWLYKHGAPGKELGTIDRCGSAEIRARLLEAAEEFGRAIGDVSDKAQETPKENVRGSTGKVLHRKIAEV